MLYQGIDVARAAGRFHRVKDIGVAKAEILLDKATRLESQRRQVTQFPKMLGEMERKKIPRRLCVRK